MQVIPPMTAIHPLPHDIAKLTEEWRAVYVKATFVENFDPELIYSEDWAAPGCYEVMVPADMDDTTAAACAMGGFHSTVPIKRLYMFEFTVFNESGDDELEPDHDQDWYALAKRCGKVYCCSKEYDDDFTEAADQPH